MAVQRLSVAISGELLTVAHAGGVATVTQAEADAWLAHPANLLRSDAEVEARINSLLDSRRAGLTEAVVVKLLGRAPIVIAVWVGPLGMAPPPTWWVEVAVG